MAERKLLRTLRQLAESGERAAFCTVVETVGSTPQKAGAQLILRADGRSLGTLGGGCVEAEARKQAMRLMHEGQPRLLAFRLDGDYGWDDGLICGGSMRIFVDMTDRPEDRPVFAKLAQLIDADVPAVWAVLIDGPPEQVGRKVVLGADGSRVGSLGDSQLDQELLPHAVRAVSVHRPIVWDLPDGRRVYLEAVLPQVRLILCGAGHVGKAVSELAAFCDFHVTVIDDRAEFANPENLPHADEILVEDIPQALRRLRIDPMTFVVIVTRGHRHDEACLHAVIDSEAGYIGMIGSKRKVKLIFDDLIEMGVAPERLDRVYAPIGLDIGSQTVPEIAVSIVAQLIQIRNSRKIEGMADRFRACFEG